MVFYLGGPFRYPEPIVKCLTGEFWDSGIFDPGQPQALSSMILKGSLYRNRFAIDKKKSPIQLHTFMSEVEKLRPWGWGGAAIYSWLWEDLLTDIVLILTLT